LAGLEGKSQGKSANYGRNMLINVQQIYLVGVVETAVHFLRRNGHILETKSAIQISHD
jgi:hypothetical protein